MTKSILSFGPSLAALLLAGCAVTDQLHSDLTYHRVSAGAVFLDDAGIGVLTPSAPTGQESDKQALGDALGDALTGGTTGAHVKPLPEMLSAINESGLAREYANMLAAYEDTGILERDVLRRIGEAGGVRYLAKLNLGDFNQSSDKRLAIAGIRMFDTWRAAIRVHLEVWDSVTGTIAWQGNEELVLAQERVRERPVSFRQVAQLASERLVDKVGESGGEVSDEKTPTVAANDLAARGEEL